ncbi:hypothetical protein TVAG_198780 [Trichomonas vaginalis G3]|uniref:SEP domain-containing protein n=1 Tax=Trichomonas vaginalis (strain ATCC PRA-98 / G3) TaxID=412133 RepID=A2DDR3_TRIV3|nr:UBA-like domain family [Trichomonas vaginalis G3]EAY21439.1 hypothetical protein TVAG_198780 [Trichomonas vaginalis G3]KAI5490652.1 UBA-like domain family [Trichomonas vaginalis G3]|eukprot:XP_001582425.1 hypothetical protein [Trichomonas vaginalis G3]
MSHCTEEGIAEFQQVTASSRRAAIWFITHNSDLNDAVSNYFDRGESSIPESFDPDEDGSGSSDTDDTFLNPTSDGISDDGKSDDSLTKIFEEPPIEPQEPKFILQQGVVEENEDQITPIQIDNTNIESGSQLSYVLDKVAKNIEVTQDIVEKEEQSFKPRKQIGKHCYFVLWKDGFTFNDQFYNNSSINREDVLRKISLGQLPIHTDEFNDIQFINRINDDHTTEKIIYHAFH